MQKILAQNNNCPQKDSSENDSYVGMQTFMWMTENILVEVSLKKEDWLERILSPFNMNAACKRVVQNGGNGGVDDLGISYLTTHKNELITSRLFINICERA